MSSDGKDTICTDIECAGIALLVNRLTCRQYHLQGGSHAASQQWMRWLKFVMFTPLTPNSRSYKLPAAAPP
jgi:hypothetical protein